MEGGSRLDREGWGLHTAINYYMEIKQTRRIVSDPPVKPKKEVCAFVERHINSLGAIRLNMRVH